MRNVKKISILLILLVFRFSASAENVYRWVDKEGILNFTDDYNKISPPFE